MVVPNNIAIGNIISIAMIIAIDNAYRIDVVILNSISSRIVFGVVISIPGSNFVVIIRDAVSCITSKIIGSNTKPILNPLLVELLQALKTVLALMTELLVVLSTALTVALL